MSVSAPVKRPILNADPGANYRRHAQAIDAAIQRVLQAGQFILGPEVEAFEREFASYQGCGYAVGVANGTDALELALRAVGVRSGDWVATVANTVTATVAAIAEIGARPVYVDVDPVTLTMRPELLEQALKATKIAAVVPVHLYGQPADLPLLCEIARRHGAVVVEDCAQAHGATLEGRKVGTWGDLAAFSFYPTKNLGAVGDGGAVVTRRPELAERVKALRQYGWKTRYVAAGRGRNSRLDELQAAILRAKLPALDEENQRRRAYAQRYRVALASTLLQLPSQQEGAVYHQFVIRTPRRDSLRERLVAAGIHAAVLYPVPVHQQAAYAEPQTVLPQTEQACREVLSLPVHPDLTEAEIDQVIQVVLDWSRP